MVYDTFPIEFLLLGFLPTRQHVQCSCINVFVPEFDANIERRRRWWERIETAAAAATHTYKIHCTEENGGRENVWSWMQTNESNNFRLAVIVVIKIEWASGVDAVWVCACVCMGSKLLIERKRRKTLLLTRTNINTQTRRRIEKPKRNISIRSNNEIERLQNTGCVCECAGAIEIASR